MSSYTKEPWRLSNNTAFGWVTNPHSVLVRKPKIGVVTVANIPARKSISDEEQLANARLITAAPDLLEALKTAVKLNGFREFNDHIPAMKAAINKAEGK